METPGLSSLEAAAMKCNLLITDRGDTKYYFENLATYCEPGDIDSIRSGILKVMSTDFNESLFNRVTTQFTWEKTAEQTYEAYKYALNRCD